MKFGELHNTIPYAKGGKEKVLRYSPYPNVTIAMPGRHWKDTVPVGGDFVVMVTDPVFDIPDHQFTHTDIFKDVELKKPHPDSEFFMKSYLDVVSHYDPMNYSPGDGVIMPGVDFNTFLCAAQCLAVAEHRRYAEHEKKWGGRYLPFRFAAGIAQGLWTAADCAYHQKRGRIGVEKLEKEFGVPELTLELMS